MSEAASSPRIPSDNLYDPHWIIAACHGKFLEIPVLYRILIANCIVIVVGALLGTAIATGSRGSNQSPIMVGFVICGLLLSIVVNFVLLKLFFSPLTRLRETMRRVEAGDMQLRASITGLDPDADALAATFNRMIARIDDLAKSRATQILRAQEEERKHIARELHDETSQALTSLLISLAMMEHDAKDEAARARIDQARALTHQTLRTIRDLSIDLRPSALDDLGLLPALRGYIKDYQQKVGITVEFTAQGFKERSAPEIETALYRIMQEALTNTARHAHATRVTVDLRQEDDKAHVFIRDNGSGFDATAILKLPAAERGLGLVGMTERAKLLGGNIDIRSRPGHGATIEVVIPLLPALEETHA